MLFAAWPNSLLNSGYWCFPGDWFTRFSGLTDTWVNPIQTTSFKVSQCFLSLYGLDINLNLPKRAMVIGFQLV